MELEFAVKDSLRSFVVASSLLEAGLTFILYQRGQIPLPFQQLEKSALLLNEQNKADADKHEGGNRIFHRHILSEEGQLVDMQNVPNVGVNPRDRISLMIHERRKRLLDRRLEKQRKLVLAAESKAFNAIKPALEILRHLCQDLETCLKGELQESSRVLSVALILGASVYTPKEMFVFDTHVLNETDESDNPLASQSEEFQNNILRQFYKAIITNPDLLDFTSKPLVKTYAHICVMSPNNLDAILSANSLRYKDVIRLSTIPSSLFEAFNRVQTETATAVTTKLSCGQPQSRLRNKCFRIKICDSKSKICTSNFSNDNLFDNNSFSCYQIPLRFKGVQCKNK